MIIAQNIQELKSGQTAILRAIAEVNKEEWDRVLCDLSRVREIQDARLNEWRDGKLDDTR